MDERYRAYNELTFESYCMTSIKRAVRNGRKQKARRAAVETPFSALPEAALRAVYSVYAPQEQIEQEGIPFSVCGLEIVIHDLKLGRAIFYLPKQKRDVLLLSYFMDMSDVDIGRMLNISKSAAQRQRTGAMRRLRELLEV